MACAYVRAYVCCLRRGRAPPHARTTYGADDSPVSGWTCARMDPCCSCLWRCWPIDRSVARPTRPGLHGSLYMRLSVAPPPPSLHSQRTMAPPQVYEVPDSAAGALLHPVGARYMRHTSRKAACLGRFTSPLGNSDDVIVSPCAPKRRRRGRRPPCGRA